MAVSAGVQRRAQKRLAYLRTRNPNALPGIHDPSHVNLKQAVRIKAKYVSRRQQEKQQAAAKAKKQPQPYNPLAPLTGKEFNKELGAATNLEFGDRERAQKAALASSTQHQADVGTYYDDYKKALDEASARIQANHDQAIAAQTQMGDTAAQQDQQRLQAQQAADAEQAAKFGRPAPDQSVGQQALEARHAMNTSQVGTMRQTALANEDYQARRSATSVQAKAEALQRAHAKVAASMEEGKNIAKDKGDFKVNFRTKTRADERTWALSKKEFGLKKAELQMKAKTSAADRKLEQSKLRTQRIVANIYASADKSKAAAQVRVAKLQLKKGKIDQHQYRTIVNTYHGLPAKGSSGGSGSGGKGSPKNVGGSGPGGSYAPWEKDKIDLAYRSLVSAHATPDERRVMIDNLVKRGQIPARLARAAWARYEKKVLKGTVRGPQGLPIASGNQ